MYHGVNVKLYLIHSLNAYSVILQLLFSMQYIKMTFKRLLVSTHLPHSFDLLSIITVELKL